MYSSSAWLPSSRPARLERRRDTTLARDTRTDAALFLAAERDVVVEEVVLVDPDLFFSRLSAALGTIRNKDAPFRPQARWKRDDIVPGRLHAVSQPSGVGEGI
jgi:hypothetical protein